MKRTLNVNIGSMSFVMDDDAYEMLRKYLDDIASRLDKSDMDSMEDIESRIAEIFCEKISSPMQVVTVEMVQRAIVVIGNPEMFGLKKESAAAADATEQPNIRKFYRSRKNRVIAGVCGGIGEYYGTDPSLIRVLAILVFFFMGFGLLAYIVIWIFIPEEPLDKRNVRRREYDVA